jgi:hypothetical protein
VDVMASDTQMGQIVSVGVADYGRYCRRSLWQGFLPVVKAGCGIVGERAVTGRIGLAMMR